MFYFIYSYSYFNLIHWPEGERKNSEKSKYYCMNVYYAGTRLCFSAWEWKQKSQNKNDQILACWNVTVLGVVQITKAENERNLLCYTRNIIKTLGSYCKMCCNTSAHWASKEQTSKRQISCGQFSLMYFGMWGKMEETVATGQKVPGSIPSIFR